MDNLSDEELNDFYQTCLIPKYYPNVVAELKDKKMTVILFISVQHRLKVT